ncbi:methyltransferase domain-containing protein [Candidatus Uhrbacteria bacterium]|nr:methyltransferase domain-containing protein [Candidatus Uhrbacteria bacterium]
MLNPTSVLEKLGLTIGMKLADLGCGGAGHFVLPAARMVGQAGKVYAIDVMQTVLQSVESKARLENLTNIQYVWADVEMPGSTKIPDNSTDIAIIKNVLFQSQKHAAIIGEAARMLRVGGRLLVVDWKSPGSPFGPPLNIRVRKEDVRKIASGLGLRELAEFEAGRFHYGLIFEK